jgi:hypothetical protein
MALAIPRLGICPLTSALRKLQPTSEHLTPIHADLFQLYACAHATAGRN